MLRNPRQVWLFVANKARRWLCTVIATESTPTKSGNRPPFCGWKKPIESSKLYHKLSALDPNNGSMTLFLDNCVLNLSNTRDSALGLFNQLRKDEQFSHALQLLEWMEMRGIQLSFAACLKRIDLLWKTRGIVAAEKYFKEMPITAKSESTYGVLLNCYCKEKMTGKATALVEEMKKLKFELNALFYSSLMEPHMKLGEAEKVQALAEEMKENNIAPNIVTYRLLMSSYASVKDIEGVERILKEMEGTSEVKLNLDFYCNLAEIYVGAGLYEKADSILKEMERTKMLSARTGFHSLMRLYAAMGNAAEVNRIWESLKSSFPETTNMSYLVMLHALCRLKDLDSLKKCFDKWKSQCSHYDIRMVNVLLTAYLTRDMIEEGKVLLEHAEKNGSKPNFTTYCLFMDFYIGKSSIDSALKWMEIACSDLRENQKLIVRGKAHIFFKYFEKEKDVDAAEDLCRIFKQANCLDQDVYYLLLCVYTAAGRTEPRMRQRMKADAVEINSETEMLLEYVCPDHS